MRIAYCCLCGKKITDEFANEYASTMHKHRRQFACPECYLSHTFEPPRFCTTCGAKLN